MNGGKSGLCRYLLPILLFTNFSVFVYQPTSRDLLTMSAGSCGIWLSANLDNSSPCDFL